MKRKGIPLLWGHYVKKKSAEKEVVTGFEPNIFYKEVDGNSKGFDITGLIKYVGGDSKGFDITGGMKYVKGDSKGISITGIYNYSEGVCDWLVQYGTVANIVEEVDDDDFVLQVGLGNKAGNQYCPIINVKGIKNLPRILGLKKK